jgi:choline dehydrogenase-like flavoprotein
MIVNATDISEAKATVGKTIIVGSGPVGLILAIFLSRQGYPVLLIEGGASIARPEVANDLKAEITASALPGVTVGRTRQIGGGLNLWGGQLASLELSEFDAQSDGSLGWPITSSEIKSRFPKVAELLGESSISLPPQSDLFDAERVALAAVGLDVVATAWLKRPKLSANIWRELRNSPAITLVHDAFVDRIHCDRVDGTVEGVSALLENGRRIRFAGPNTVLACGTIETSRLLLQMSESGCAQPWHALPWLGRGFNEHLDATTGTIRPLNRRRLLDFFDPIMIDGTKYTHKIFSQTEGMDGFSLSCVAMLSMPGNMRNSIAELRMLLRSLTPRQAHRDISRIATATIASVREIAPVTWRYLRHKRISSVFRGGAALRVSVEQPVRAECRITLSTKMRDRRGVPAASIHWKTGVEEGRAFLDATRKVKRWAEDNAIAELEIDQLLLQDPATFAARADDGLHHSGGVRMTRKPQDGVVDPDLKVFGVEGLYCCGSAVFPRSGFANPTMTSMALAVRLGEHLIATGRASA